MRIEASTSPNLSQDQVQSIELTGGQTPNVRQGLIWRLADREKDARWRVSLGVDFVALETSSYDSRVDFLDHLRAVVSARSQARYTSQHYPRDRRRARWRRLC